MQLAFMLAAPGQYKLAVERQINDAEPLMRTGFITTHIEKRYVDQAVTEAVYTGMYERGKDGFGPWDGDPPPWDEVSSEFDDAITRTMREEYAGAIGTGSRCGLVGNNGIVLSTTDDETTITASMDGQFNATCRSLHITFSGQLQTVTARENISITEEYEVPGIRYQQMHEVARTIGEGRTIDEIHDEYGDEATVQGFDVSIREDGPRVAATITDPENTIPTGDGFVNPVYNVTYS